MANKHSFTWLILILSFLSAGKVIAQQAALMTLWKDTAIGAIWNQATLTVAYGKPDANGYYKIYLSDSLGNNETPLTYSGWRTDRHQWAEEWDPSGQYLFCYVEKPDYAIEAGHTRIPGDAIPGYGAYTDIWLLKRDGSQAWQLTNFPNDYDHGVIHGAISRDGTKFAWTERVQQPNILDPNLAVGAYVFKVADVVYPPTPTLTNIQIFQPGNVLAGGEVESISADKSRIAVYSTFESHNIVATPIYTININDSSITKLTSESFSQCPTYAPDGNHIVYMTGKDCDIFPWSLQGADWWIMDTDSMNKVRLTYMNVTGHPQCVNAYRLAGSLSFMSANTFLGGVMTSSFGLNGYTAKVSYGNLISVPEIEAEQQLSLFPNPSSDIISIGNISGKALLTICNTVGQQQLSIKIQGNASIDISCLSAGFYSVFVRTENKIFHSAFVKR